MKTSTKECATVAFRYENAWRKVRRTFLDVVNQGTAHVVSV